MDKAIPGWAGETNKTFLATGKTSVAPSQQLPLARFTNISLLGSFALTYILYFQKMIFSFKKFTFQGSFVKKGRPAKTV